MAIYKKGSKGDVVRQIQSALGLIPDGVFGVMTENAVKKFQQENGLIVDLGGQKPTFKNNDNGEIEEEENIIKVGTVMDAGTKCEYLKEGDVVMYNRHSSSPVPFFRQGLETLSETRVLAVINEGLTDRFSKKD